MEAGVVGGIIILSSSQNMERAMLHLDYRITIPDQGV